jgi:hypothetical protein
MTTNIKSLLELAQNPKIYMACHINKTTVGRKGIVPEMQENKCLYKFA